MPNQWQTVDGTWKAGVGPIILTVKNGTVSGIYNEGLWALQLEYSADKKTLHGQWDHLNGLAGPVIFYLSDYGCIQYGKYGRDEATSCTLLNDSACIYIWAVHGKIM